MRASLLAPLAVLAAGIAMIVAAVAAGEADVSLLLIFPVISGSGWLFAAGTLLVILSFVLGLILLARGYEGPEIGPETMLTGTMAREPTQKQTKYGGVVLIGPIPIAFGSDKKTATLMLVIGVVLAVVLLGLLILLA